MFVLRHKFDVIIRIRQVKALIEKEIGKSVKQVRTDKSMEFCSKLLNEFCMKEGIVRHRISADESQHVAELMSITLLETAHKIIASVGMA